MTQEETCNAKHKFSSKQLHPNYPLEPHGSTPMQLFENLFFAPQPLPMQTNLKPSKFMLLSFLPHESNSIYLSYIENLMPH